MRIRESVPAKIALTVGAAVAAAFIATSVAGHAHADPTCQFLGQNYPVQYDCLQNQPWLPYGTYDNPPLSGGLGPATVCSDAIQQHDMACTG